MAKCSKVKFDKIGVMLALARVKSPAQKSHNRQEKRYYICPECGFYHLTSQEKKSFKR